MKQKLLQLTAKVSKIMCVTDCWCASLILRDVINTHTPWIAEVVACSVTVKDWDLDEHCVVECNGYLCDATASQIPGAPTSLVAEFGKEGYCQVGDVLYRPCVSEEFVAIVSGSASYDSSEAVSHGAIKKEDLETLLTQTVVKTETACSK